jgi:hypothetical protein
VASDVLRDAFACVLGWNVQTVEDERPSDRGLGGRGRRDGQRAHREGLQVRGNRLTRLLWAAAFPRPLPL